MSRPPKPGQPGGQGGGPPDHAPALGAVHRRPRHRASDRADSRQRQALRALMTRWGWSAADVDAVLGDDGDTRGQFMRRVAQLRGGGHGRP